MVKLSLCVPVYGVEKYIPKFLSSLENNLQPGIEVLLINDGTKDNSGKLADEFAAKYPDYIKVIHKENGGVSSARNKALELANGEYVIFPDSDDFLTNDYVSTILQTIEKYDSPDFIFFDYYVGSEKKGFKRHTLSNFREGIIAKELFIREHIKDINIRGYMHVKAIKKTFFEGLWFNTNTRIAEDYELLTDLVLRIEKIVYIPKALYYYVQRAGSLTNTNTLADAKKFYELTLDRYTKHSQFYKGLSFNKVVKAAALVLIKVYAENLDDNNEFSEYKMIINKNIMDVIFSGDYKINDKKQCLLIFLGIGKFYYRMKYKN